MRWEQLATERVRRSTGPGIRLWLLLSFGGDVMWPTNYQLPPPGTRPMFRLAFGNLSVYSPLLLPSPCPSIATVISGQVGLVLVVFCAPARKIRNSFSSFLQVS